MNGKFAGRYPSGTVTISCSGKSSDTFRKETYRITGHLTVTPSCTGTSARAQAHTDGHPATSAPGRLNLVPSRPGAHHWPAAGYQARAGARRAEKRQAGGLTVTITSSIFEPPPEPVSNQVPYGAYFSIPPDGHKNHWQRYYDLTYTVKRGSRDVTRTADITNATVNLDDSDGNPLQEKIVDEGPGEDGKVLVLGACRGVVQIQVSYSGDTTSTVDSTPPPANQIEYAFTLNAKNPADNETGKSEEYTAAPVYALWKMPNGLPRCSPCGAAGHESKGPGGMTGSPSQLTTGWPPTGGC